MRKGQNKYAGEARFIIEPNGSEIRVQRIKPAQLKNLDCVLKPRKAAVD